NRSSARALVGEPFQVGSELVVVLEQVLDVGVRDAEDARVGLGDDRGDAPAVAQQAYLPEDLPTLELRDEEARAVLSPVDGEDPFLDDEKIAARRLLLDDAGSLGIEVEAAAVEDLPDVLDVELREEALEVEDAVEELGDLGV